MNSRLLVAFLCLASLSTGCIVVDEDRYPGDVTFIWTFAGMRCDQARDVYGVNISIPGESLHNSGRYACNTEGVDGITLHDFAPGTYNFNIEAVDYRGVVIFEGRGSFRINGDARVNIDLTPVGSETSYAYLNWTFPGGRSCAQAGVSSVEITVDELGTTEVPCIEGQRDPGKQTPYLTPGQHSISFTAYDLEGRPLYYFDGTLFTEAFRPVSASYSLTDGGASISWRFSDGSITFNCGQGGTSFNMPVRVDFQDMQTGEWVFESDGGDWHPCETKPIIYRHLRPGLYKVALYARTASGAEYFSNPNIPPLMVEANQYPGEFNPLEVVMYRR